MGLMSEKDAPLEAGCGEPPGQHQDWDAWSWPTELQGSGGQRRGTWLISHEPRALWCVVGTDVNGSAIREPL